VNAKRELFLGHGLERAEVRLAGRACERVEAPDPAVHGPHGIARADVHLDVARLPSGHDHIVSSRERLDHRRADGSGAPNHDDAHETALRWTLSSPRVPRRVTTTKRRSPQPNGARRRVCPHRPRANQPLAGEVGACHLGLGIRPASRAVKRDTTTVASAREQASDRCRRALAADETQSSALVPNWRLLSAHERPPCRHDPHRRGDGGREAVARAVSREGCQRPRVGSS
jgi:hypothetical protein